MAMKKFATLVTGIVLSALTISCETTTTNTNVANGNRAVTTNSNANTAPPTNANANANTKKAPTKEDVEKNKQSYEKEAKDTGRKIGTGASDLWLWVKTRYELAAADDLKDSTINVDVDNGVITLTGTVANQEQVKKADAIAKSIEGQKGVQNKLKAAPGGGNANTTSNKSANTKK